VQAFGLLNLVIERCGEALAPHALALASALPRLWDAAAGQSLLRIQASVLPRSREAAKRSSSRTRVAPHCHHTTLTPRSWTF
jgi:hypothetical protein